MYSFEDPDTMRDPIGKANSQWVVGDTSGGKSAPLPNPGKIKRDFSEQIALKKLGANSPLLKGIQQQASSFGLRKSAAQKKARVYESSDLEILKVFSNDYDKAKDLLNEKADEDFDQMEA